MLLAGDLFDGERVYPETLERLRETLVALACPVFIAPGNHDPFTPRSPYARQSWPENVHIFRGGALEAVELPELGCVVHGAAFTAPERTDQVLAGLTAPADGLVHILCLHGEVNAPASQYGPITREQIAASGLTYLALGHVHQCSGLQRQGDSFWAYPGCPEGRGFDELGDKGVLAGTVERGRVSLDFVPLCRRRYHILTADVTGRNPRQALEEAMPATASDDVCRVIFTGETGEAGIDLAGLTGDYRDRFYALELRDQTGCPGTSGTGRGRTASGGFSCGSCGPGTTPRRTRRSGKRSPPPCGSAWRPWRGETWGDRPHIRKEHISAALENPGRR